MAQKFKILRKNQGDRQSNFQILKRTPIFIISMDSLKESLLIKIIVHNIMLT